MFNSDKPAFSDRALNTAENIQYRIGKTTLGTFAVSLLTGSNSPVYEQLLWLPRSKVRSAGVAATATVLGNPSAGRFARSWALSAVLAVRKDEMERLRTNENCDAVAYISDKIVHVGISATNSIVLNELDDIYSGVAVRRGPGKTQFSVGTYSHERQEFFGVDSGGIAVRDSYLPIDLLPRAYPSIRLV